MSSARIASIRAALGPISAARVEQVRKVVEGSLGRCDAGRPAGPDLRRAPHALERRCTFSPAARAAFHDLLARLGVPTALPIGLPIRVLRAAGARQAAPVLGLARRHRDALRDILRRERAAAAGAPAPVPGDAGPSLAGTMVRACRPPRRGRSLRWWGWG